LANIQSTTMPVYSARLPRIGLDKLYRINFKNAGII